MEAPVGINTSRSVFHRELERLQDEVLVLGSMVEKAITRSVDALKSRNTTAAACGSTGTGFVPRSNSRRSGSSE